MKTERRITTGTVLHGKRPLASRPVPRACAVFQTAWGWMGVSVAANGLRAGVFRIVLPRASRRAAEAELARAWGEARGLSLAPRAPVTHAVLREARAQVVAYLEGKRRDLNMPLNLSAGTAFQRRVWRAALRIPYGRVRSYQWVAAKVGGTKFARAVGHALGANPLPLIVPCHRVVASDGTLGGFAGGLRVKRRLLALEGTLPLLRRKRQ